MKPETIKIEIAESEGHAKSAIICNKKLGEDFLDWIENECDGEKATYELFEEFMELEETFRPALIRALEKVNA